MIVALVIRGDYLALLDDVGGRHVGPLEEELGRRIGQNPVLLDGDQEAVLGEAQPGRDRLGKRRRELLHLGGDAAVRAVDDRPDLVARADEGGDALRADRDLSRARHHRVKRDVKTLRQLDLLQRILDRVDLGPGLRQVRDRCRLARLQHLPERFQGVRRGGWLGHGRQCGQGAGEGECGSRRSHAVLHRPPRAPARPRRSHTPGRTGCKIAEGRAAAERAGAVAARAEARYDTYEHIMTVLLFDTLELSKALQPSFTHEQAEARVSSPPPASSSR